MKYNIFKGLAILSAMPLAMVQCAKEEIEPDSRPSGNTVTLTLKSPSADDTKTWLGDQGQVFWSENDQIYINDSWYTVVPDPDDPSVATVEGVTESESYLAFYPSYYYSDDMSYGINIPYYQSYVWDYQDIQANPMAGYTESGELDMYNLGAIIRIGVTGNGEQLDRMTLWRNDGKPVAGTMLVPETHIKESSYSDAYSDFAPEEQYKYIRMEGFWNGETGDPLELGQEPLYFNFVVAPDTYPEGFTVVLHAYDKTSGADKYAMQSTYRSEDFFRSTITPKTPFGFKDVEAPQVTVTGQTATTVSIEVAGQRGAYIRAAAVEKSTWDEYYSVYENIQEGINSGAIGNLSREDAALCQVGESGVCGITLDKAYKETANPVNISADTEYAIVVAYADMGDVITPAAMATAKTDPASGEAPQLDISLSERNAYDELDVNIRAEGAASVAYAVFSAVRYDYEKAGGITDEEIIAEYGYILDDEEVAEASGAGCTISLDEYGQNGLLSELYPDTEYVLIVSAQSEGGMVSTGTVRGKTAVHIDPDGTWAPVGTGKLYFDFVGKEYDVAIERMTGTPVYRFVSPLNTDQDFLSRAGEYGITAADNGSHYIYLDLVDDYDFKMPAFENMVGLEYSEGEAQSGYPLFMTSSGYAEISEYAVRIDTYVGLNYQTETGELGWCMDFNMTLEFEVPQGTGLPGGASNEDFDIKDEIQWQ